MKPKSRYCLMLPFRAALATTVVLSSSLAMALTWDGGAGDSLWTTGLNWDSNLVPLPTDDLVFGTGSGTILLNGNQTANSLVLTSNFTLGAYGIANTLTNTSGSLTVNSGVLTTVNAALTTPFGDLSLSGGGTLFLNNPKPNFSGNWLVDGAGTTLLYRPEGPTNQYNAVGGAMEAPRGDQLALGIGTLAKNITLSNGGTYKIFGSNGNPDGGFKNIVIGSGGGKLDLAAGCITQTFDDAGQIAFTTEAFTKAGKGRLILAAGAADGNPLGGIVNIDGGMLSLDRLQGGVTTAGTRFSGIAAAGTTVNINSGGTLLINNGTQGRLDVPTVNLNNGGILAVQGNDAHIIGLDAGGTTLNVSGTASILLRDLFNPQQARLPRLRSALTGDGTLDLVPSANAGGNPRLVIERGVDSTFSGIFRLQENAVLEANPRFNTTANTGKVIADGDINFAGWGNILDLRDSTATTSVFDYTTNNLSLTSTQAGSLIRVVVQRGDGATGTGHLFNFGTLSMGNQRLTIEGNNSYQAGLSGTAAISGNAVIEMRSDNTPLVLANPSALSGNAAGRLTIFKTGQGNAAARDVISGGAISLSNLQVATGTLQLRGANGTITTGAGGSLPIITVNGGANPAYTNSMPTQGVLHLDNNTGHVVGTSTVFAAANNNNRLVDSATLNLRGNSILRLTSASNTGTTETVGTTTVTGHGTFDVVKTGTPLSPVALTLSTLNIGTNATANFTGTSLGLAGANSSRIVIPGTATGVLPSRFHSGNEWAKYDSTADNGFALGVTPFVAGDYTLNTAEATWAAGQQVKLTLGGTFLTGSRTVDRFNMQVAGANSINLNTFNLTTAQGGILTSTGTAVGFIDTNAAFPATTGALTAGVGAAPAQLNFYANTLTDIKVPVANNADGGVVDFVKSGTATLRLTHQTLGVGSASSAVDPYADPTWTSTLTGSWIVTDGRLEVHRGQYLGGRPVILDGGHLEINQPVSNANADTIIPGWGNNITINANAAVAADDNGESADGNTGDRAMVQLGALTINNGSIMGHSSFSDIDIAYMGGATFNGTPTLNAIRGGTNSATIINGVLAGSGFNTTATNGNASVILGGGAPDTAANTYDGAITAFASTIRLNKANGITALTDGAASEDIVLNGGTLAWGPGHHGDLSTTNNINLTNNGLLGIAPTSPAAVLAAGMNQIADTADITLLTGTLGEGDRINNETFGTLVMKNGTFNVGLGSIVVNDATISGGAFNIDRSGSFTAGTLTLLQGAPDLNITTGIPAGARTTLAVGAGGLSMNGQNITLGTGSSGNVMGAGGVLKLGGNLTHTGTDLIAGSYGRKGIFVQTGSTFRQLGNSHVDLMGGNRTFTIDTDSIFTVTVPLANGGLVKAGGGALVLEPYQTSGFTGAITVNDGILQAKGDGAFGTSAGGVTINNGGTVKLDSGWTYGDAFTVTGSGALVPGGLGVREVGALIAESGTNRLTGAVTISGGATLAGNTFLDPSATPAGGGVAYRIGTLRIESAGGLTGSGTVTLSGHGDGVIVNGIKTSSGGVNKDGAGRWTIGNASTYSGTTMVSAGTLRITNGAALGTTGSGTTVYGGGSLELVGGISVAEPMTIGGDGSSTQSGAIVNVSGTNTLTGPITLLGTTLRSDAGTLNVNTSVTGAAGTSLTLSGSGTGAISGAVSVGAPLAGNALTKNGRGTWTLSGANAISGSTAVNGGTLVLNSAGSALGAAFALNMGGGSLVNTGAAQTVNGLNLLSGGGTVTGGAGLALGAITPTAGATVNFAGTVTTTTPNTNGILGGFATYGTNWATVGGGSTLAGYAAYTPLATATATDNATIAVGSLAAPGTVNSLRIIGAGLDLGANNLTLASGGLLFSGTGNSAILGTGLLSGTDSSSELIVHTVGSGTLDIAAPIIGTGTGGLTKAGDGTLFLSGTNSFTGPININGGTLAVTNPAAMGSTASPRDITLNGGTIQILGDYDLVMNTLQLVVGSAGGTVRSGFGAQITINDGSATDLVTTQLRGSGDLTFTGGGRYTLSGGNPQFPAFTGNATVNGGILTVGNSYSLGGRQEQTLTLMSGSAIINNTGFGLGLNGLPNNIVAGGGVEFFALGGNRVFAGDIQLSGTNTIALFERDTLNQERQVYFNGRVSGTDVTLNVFGANNGNPFYLASGSNDLTGTININPNAVLEARVPGSLGINDGDVTINLATNSRLLLRHFQNADYHSDVVVNGHAEINSDRLANYGGGAQQFMTIHDLTVNGDNTILTVGGGNNYYTRVSGTTTLNGATSNILNVTASDLILENGLTFGTPASTLDKRGGFTAILREPTNHTGKLVVQGGLVYLLDNGALPTTSAIDLRGGTLQVDNSNLALPNRINDAASITLGGGALRITGPETLGTVTAASGVTQVVSNPISETVPVPLLLTGFTRKTGAIVQFQAPDLGPTAVGTATIGQARVSSRILLPVAPALADSGQTIPGFVGNNAIDFIQYSTTVDGGVALGFRDMRNPGTGAAFATNYTDNASETAWNDTVILRRTNATDATTVTDTLTANRVLDAIKVEAGGTNRDVTIALGTFNLRIEGGGILDVGNGTHDLNITGTTGILTAGPAVPDVNSTAELVLGGTTGGSGFNVGAIIGDNVLNFDAQPVAVVKVGTDTVSLNGNNTFSGGLYINAGTLNTTNANFNGSFPGTITLAGGTLQFNIANATSAIDLGVPDHAINVQANSQIVLDNGALAGTDNDITLGALTINGPYTLGLRSFDSMDATFFADPNLTQAHTFAGTPTIDMAQATSGGNKTGFFTINGEITGSGFFVGTSGNVNDTASVLQIGGGESVHNTYVGDLTLLFGNSSTGSNTDDLRVELNKADGFNAVTGDIVINGGVLRNVQPNQIADTSTMIINQGAYDAFGKNETFASVTMRGGNFRTSSGATGSNTVTVTGDFNATGLDDLGGSGDGVAANSNSTLAINGTLRLNGYSRGTIGGTASNMIVGGLEMTGTTLLQNGAGSMLRLNGDVTTFASSNTARLGGTTVVGAQIQLNGTRTFNVADGPAGLDLSVSSALTDSTAPVAAGGLIKAGPGSLQLEGSDTVNAYTGTTVVNEGSLVLFKNTGIAAIPAGALTIGDGTGGTNADQVVVRNSQQIADAAAVTIAGSGLLDLSTFNTSEQIGSLAGSGNVSLGVGSLLTIGGTDTTVFSGTIEGGGGSFAKSGTGSQVLGGSNTYSGVTTVTGGSLYVNGTHTGGGNYDVADGAILGGEGTITGNGNVTYAGGSTLQVGNPADAGGGHDLAFSLIGTGAAFTLNSSTTLSLDLWSNLHLAGQLGGANQNQSDVLAVSASTINLAGILNVANPASISSWAVGDTFDLFDWFATPTGTFTSVNLPSLGTGLVWDTSKLYTSEADDANLAGTIRVTAGSTPTPIQSWRQTNFGTTANAGDAADNADPDKDGVPNLVEYGLGMNPNVSNKTGLPTHSIATGSGVISFGRNLAATDVTYLVQASNNLTTWTDLATRTAGSGTWTTLGGVVLTDPGTGPVSVKDNVTVAAQSKRFMRVVITNPAP